MARMTFMRDNGVSAEFFAEVNSKKQAKEMIELVENEVLNALKGQPDIKEPSITVSLNSYDSNLFKEGKPKAAYDVSYTCQTLEQAEMFYGKPDPEIDSEDDVDYYMLRQVQSAFENNGAGSVNYSVQESFTETVEEIRDKLGADRDVEFFVKNEIMTALNEIDFESVISDKDIINGETSDYLWLPKSDAIAELDERCKSMGLFEEQKPSYLDDKDMSFTGAMFEVSENGDMTLKARYYGFTCLLYSPDGVTEGECRIPVPITENEKEQLLSGMMEKIEQAVEREGIADWYHAEEGNEGKKQKATVERE